MKVKPVAVTPVTAGAGLVFSIHTQTTIKQFGWVVVRLSGVTVLVVENPEAAPFVVVPCALMLGVVMVSPYGCVGKAGCVVTYEANAPEVLLNMSFAIRMASTVLPLSPGNPR